MTRSRTKRTSPGNRGLRTALGIVAIVGIPVFLFVGLVYLFIHLDQPSPVLISSTDVGRLQKALFLDRFIYKETAVETDQGTFLVRGAFVAIKGRPLVLEVRQDDSRMLCDQAEKTCAPLVR